MKLLFVHAHFDDYEFTAAGTFELWRRQHPGTELDVLICTDGAAGHHALSREATAARRFREQATAAEQGGFRFHALKGADGQPFREARLHASPGFLPALWNEIRRLEPDYLFCPPIPADPLAGVHVDHLDVAQAVRSVAYLINVPHAYTPEYPQADGEPRFIKTPVIINTFDGYLMAGSPPDLAVDITPVADHVADLAWCHESQLREWLPWVDRHGMQADSDVEGWRRQFRTLMARRMAGLGIRGEQVLEVFRVTAWGTVPTLDQLRRDFPALEPRASRFETLGARLREWSGEPPAAAVVGRSRASVPADEDPSGGDASTIRRRLEMVLGGPPGFTTGARAEVLADLLSEFGRAEIVAAIRREWVVEFDTGPEASASVVKPRAEKPSPK
ncbi:MAG: PIG-L family deacetylase [Verrucomicrobiales bacterium]|nr:PIG-L family deacetylase [Verrucomicrobiales bacterium]